MIERKLHYVWLGGGEKPPIVQQCLKTFERLRPFMDIVEWNERNYDLSRLKYAERMFQSGVHALASCQIRFDVVHQYGGIYLDTDMEVLTLSHCGPKPWLNLLDSNVEVFGLGTNPDIVPYQRIDSAFFAAPRKSPLLAEIVQCYEDTHERFITSPNMLTGHVLKHPEVRILDHQYFAPMTWEQYDRDEKRNQAGVNLRKYLTAKSLGFHWFCASWHGKTKQIP